MNAAKTFLSTIVLLIAFAPVALADVDLIRLSNDIRRCWNVPTDSDVAQVSVTVAFDLNATGEVVGDVRWLEALGGSIEAQDVAFANARRAILRCEDVSDYSLPFFEGERLKAIHMVFGPSGVQVSL